MPRFDVSVLVALRDGTFDPAAEAVSQGLASLGFEGVESLRIDRRIHFRLQAADAGAALADADRMARALLANPVLERYQVSVSTGDGA